MSGGVKLGDLCHTVTKGTTPTSLGYDFSVAGTPFLRIQNLGDHTVALDDVLYIDDETHKALKRSIIKPKDFLITIAGTIGRVAIVPDHFPECNCNQAVAILRFDHNILWPEYLLYWLSTNDALNQISGKKVTATISNLSLGQIKELEIPLPPLAEQKRIAAILDKADALRRKRQQAIDLADKFLRSVFLDMFGDPVTNPKGWPKQPLKALSKIINGNTPSRQTPENYGAGIEWIKSGNINTPDHYLTSAQEQLSALGKKIGRCVPSGSVLITCIAGSPDCIGNAAIADREVAFNQQINALVPSAASTTEYLYSLALFGKKVIQDASTNSMKGMVSKGILENVTVPAPPVELQAKYSVIFHDLLQKRERQVASLCASKELFDSVSQQAFSGKL